MPSSNVTRRIPGPSRLRTQMSCPAPPLSFITSRSPSGDTSQPEFPDEARREGKERASMRIRHVKEAARDAGLARVAKPRMVIDPGEVAEVKADTDGDRCVEHVESAIHAAEACFSGGASLDELIRLLRRCQSIAKGMRTEMFQL